MLSLLDFNKFYYVDWDVNGLVIGAIPSQEGKPIASFIEKLNEGKIKYYVYDQEFYPLFKHRISVDIIFYLRNLCYIVTTKNFGI